MKNDRPSLPVPGFHFKMHFTKRLSWSFLIHSNKCWWLPRCHTWTMICHGWFESMSAKPGPPPQCNRGAREYDYEEVTQEIHDVGRTLAISSPTCGNGKMIGRRTACQAARKNWQKSWSKTFLAVNKKNTCANDIIFSPTMFTFFKLFFLVNFILFRLVCQFETTSLRSSRGPGWATCSKHFRLRWRPMCMENECFVPVRGQRQHSPNNTYQYRTRRQDEA